MTELRKLECVPCRGGVPPLGEAKINEYLDQLDENWEVVENHHLRRTFKFPDYAAGLDLVNRVAQLAEQQDHHPNMTLRWGRVTIEIFTHSIDGLTESDFVLAAKIDML